MNLHNPNAYCVRTIIKEEIQNAKQIISLETPGFIQTSDMQDVELFMGTRILNGDRLFAVFYGKDEYAQAPDPQRPYYMWLTVLSAAATERIADNIKKFEYENYYDLWFEVTENLSVQDQDIHWFNTLHEARLVAEGTFAS